MCARSMHIHFEAIRCVEFSASILVARAPLNELKGLKGIGNSHVRAMLAGERVITLLMIG